MIKNLKHNLFCHDMYKVQLKVQPWSKYTGSNYCVYIMGVRWRPLFNKSQQCGEEGKH
jgi:hypothetical protein